MLQIKDLNYTIGERVLLSGINWIINPGKRVALIGPNGAGKTTLLRIIHNELEPNSGTIQKPKGYRIGFLPQEEISLEAGPILHIVLEGHREILDIEDEIADIHRQLENHPPNRDALLERLGSLEEKFNILGGYRLEADAKAILSGLGFSEKDYLRPLSGFSGGWRMRVYLARLLLQNPDLLLLDEPTNHLDLESLEWLEQYLKTFEGSIVIVSHDRFFIDRLAEEICELDRGKLTYYAGNYHFYEKQREIYEEQLYKKWEEQKAERERVQRFIDRFRYKASKAAQVQSRVKQLEKMEEIELLPPPRKIHFKIRVEVPSYKEVLKIENMFSKYDRDWVLKDVSLNVYRGEKIALVGVNGAGKTTLTRLIFGQLTPQQGKVQTGERVTMGYYAQHQVDTLNLNATILEEVAETAGDIHRPKLRDILGLFQFSNDDPEKRIKVLSGGEKARVSLAKMLLSPVNFLIMDEPTNHLDIASREALEKALEDYDGTLLLISHDRYFLDKLVNRVIEIKNGALRQFEGNYSAYLEKREREAALEARQQEAEKTEKSSPSRRNKEQKRQEAEARQAISKQRNQLKANIEKYEHRISELEAKKENLEKQIADPQTYRNAEKSIALQKEYAAVKEELEALLEKWEQAQNKYETLLAGVN
jgi:ATP-binding cassette subfamily F protein 3